MCVDLCGKNKLHSKVLSDKTKLRCKSNQQTNKKLPKKPNILTTIRLCGHITLGVCLRPQKYHKQQTAKKTVNNNLKLKK